MIRSACQPIQHRLMCPTLPVGLACVAAATKRKGHEVAIVDLMAEEDARQILREAIEGFHPDVIGISVRNVDGQNMKNTISLLDPDKEIGASAWRSG